MYKTDTLLHRSELRNFSFSADARQIFAGVSGTIACARPKATTAAPQAKSRRPAATATSRCGSEGSAGAWRGRTPAARRRMGPLFFYKSTTSFHDKLLR